MQWLLVPAAYLAGSISFSVLVVRALQGRDVREFGSGNAGATNVLRAAGRGPAILVLLLDVAKGAIPVAVGRWLGVEPSVLALTAVAAVVGHMYPIFHGFSGGKGVATAVGALGATSPPILALCGVVFLVVVALTRYVSLASVVSVSLFSVLLGLWALTGRAEEGSEALVGAAAVIALLIIFRHRENIRRLRTGQELRLGERTAGR